MKFTPAKAGPKMMFVEEPADEVPVHRPEAEAEAAPSVEDLFRACDPSWEPGAPAARYAVTTNAAGRVVKVELA